MSGGWSQDAVPSQPPRVEALAGRAPGLADSALRGWLGFVLAVTALSPGLYGREGILPARRVLRLGGKGLWEQLRDSPTLLWLSPHLGLDTELGMELLCLLGVFASFGALLFESLRDSLLFALLWALYLSLYQVRDVGGGSLAWMQGLSGGDVLPLARPASSQHTQLPSWSWGKVLAAPWLWRGYSPTLVMALWG